MTDRDMDRERRLRESENDSDWDWYYYEYRYEPFYPGRNYGNREGYARDYNRNYGREYARNYDQGNRWNYDPGYENDYGSSNYGMTNNWTRGRFSGVGPRGYRRSDDRIQEDINDRLTWHGQIDATEVQVEVKDGIATITGTVNSRQDKRLAEYIAESIPGVMDVQNNLKINKQTDWNQGSGGSETNQRMQEETGETSRKKL
jgi:osmotically-inducible protein OsmY